jgi:hypothetical protein
VGYIKGGDPRQNRAMAAKIVYPDLTMRECLYLGGFQDDELNAVKDQKYSWRTGEQALLAQTESMSSTFTIFLTEILHFHLSSNRLCLSKGIDCEKDRKLRECASKRGSAEG